MELFYVKMFSWLRSLTVSISLDVPSGMLPLPFLQLKVAANESKIKYTLPTSRDIGHIAYQIIYLNTAVTSKNYIRLEVKQGIILATKFSMEYMAFIGPVATSAELKPVKEF